MEVIQSGVDEALGCVSGGGVNIVRADPRQIAKFY